MPPRPGLEYLIARIFGIPSLCRKGDRLAVSSANVGDNRSEIHGYRYPTQLYILRW